MKTPRITDFDPDAKVPTLKSSMDSMPTIQKQSPAHRVAPRPDVISGTPNHEEVRTRKPVGEQPTAEKGKRSFVRRTFDFYDDQSTYLTRESLQERLAGKEKSMNEMVRDALDDWIKKRTSGK